MENYKEKIIWPPERVKSLVELNRDLFRKIVDIPFVTTNVNHLEQVQKSLKPYILKMVNFSPVKIFEDNNTKQFKIYLNPDLLDEIFNITLNNLSANVSSINIVYEKYELTYENFPHIDIFRAIFPTDNDGLKGFSTVGHIVHLNLRDHLLPYKNLIGQVRDKKSKTCFKNYFLRYYWIK